MKIQFDSWTYRIIFFTSVFALLLIGMSVKATPKKEFRKRHAICLKEQERVQNKHPQTHKVWKPSKK